MADEMATRMGLKEAKDKKLNTIQKLDLQAEKELEKENNLKRSNRRGTYETIISKRDGRTIGRSGRDK